MFSPTLAGKSAIRARPFTIGSGRIVEIEMLADPVSISKLDLSILER
jgi:hypothetical protein